MTKEKYNILVIGDSCRDEFVYGDCPRLAPEAPVPIFKVGRTIINPGMAANVKANLEAMARVYDVDINVDLLTNPEKIIKTRFIDRDSNHMIMRIDDEPIVKLADLSETDFTQYDVAVIADYNKGFLTEDLIRYVTGQVSTFIDTKKLLGNWAFGATFIKINKHEYGRNLNHVPDEMEDRLIVTHGEDGAMYKSRIYPTENVPISDISGAGDTFMAGFVFNYIQTNNPVEAIEFAQECACKVVSKRGVSTI